MKEIIRLKFWQLLIAAVAVGILCHFAFAFSMWAVALAVVFIWFAEKYSKLLYVPAVIIIGSALFSSYLPITASKAPSALQKVDLMMGQNIDQVQIAADVILEKERSRKKKALLRDYTKLLQAGKVEEAKKLMESINVLFYPKKVYEAPVAAQPIQPVTPPVVQPVPPAPTSGLISSNDSIFPKGTYFINVKGETPFNIVIAPSRGGCARYSLSSEKYNYQILFPGEQPIQGDPKVRIKHYERPTFKLASSGETVKLTVS